MPLKIISPLRIIRTLLLIRQSFSPSFSKTTSPFSLTTAYSEVTHEMNNLDYLTSEYAVVNEAGEVVFEKEGEKLCLINSKVLMMRNGEIIFSGTDETLRRAEDPYIHKFLRGH